MNLAEMCERYRKLYTPAVADALDKQGYWNQIMAHSLQPLRLGMKLAGPAFTMLGTPSRETDKT